MLIGTTILLNLQHQVAFRLIYAKRNFFLVSTYAIYYCVSTKYPGKSCRSYISISHIDGIQIIAVTFFFVNRKTDFRNFIKCQIEILLAWTIGMIGSIYHWVDSESRNID